MIFRKASLLTLLIILMTSAMMVYGAVADEASGTACNNLWVRQNLRTNLNIISERSFQRRLDYLSGDNTRKGLGFFAGECPGNRITDNENNDRIIVREAAMLFLERLKNPPPVPFFV